MLPSWSNIQAALEVYELLHNWKASDASLRHLFGIFPANDNLDEVLAKVATLDTLYGTNLRNPVGMARRIVEANGLDQLLAAGDRDVVDLIAQGPERRELVFASKYAHFQNPDMYPILDKYAGRSVWHFCRLALLAGGDSDIGEFKENRPWVYARFADMCEEILDQTGLSGKVTWVQLDRYMWLYGLKKACDARDMKVGRDFKEMYSTPEGKHLMVKLEPQ